MIGYLYVYVYAVE